LTVQQITMDYTQKITKNYNIPCTIPASTFDVEFKIIPIDSDMGGTTYKMSGNFPPNFLVQEKNRGVRLSTCDNEYILNVRRSYDIYMNDKLACKLVPTTKFVMIENTTDSKEVCVADFFTYEQFDNLTICLTTTSNFDDLVLHLVRDDIECHKYDGKYYLPIENQQYFVKNPDHSYFLFLRTHFEMKPVVES
jgi:hypothetical protein